VYGFEQWKQPKPIIVYDATHHKSLQIGSLLELAGSHLSFGFPALAELLIERFILETFFA
jgi:hypothetical protein